MIQRILADKRPAHVTGVVNMLIWEHVDDAGARNELRLGFVDAVNEGCGELFIVSIRTAPTPTRIMSITEC